MALSQAERLDLMNRLLEAAVPGDDDLPEAEWNGLWAEEAERRLDEVRRGEVEMIPADVVHETILRRLAG